MVSILVGILTAPILFFLPGYFWSLSLPWVRGFTVRLAVSLVTSVALGVLLSYGAALFDIPVGAALFAGLLLTSAGFGWTVRRRLFEAVSEWREVPRSEKMMAAGLVFLCVVAGIFVSLPHFGYPWPVHGDEWWSVGEVQNLLEGRSLDTHPYFLDPLTNYKPGLTAYLSGIFSLWRVDPVSAWAHLPGANLFFIALISSLLLFSITRDKLVALAVPVFLAAVRSNAYMLGWWFFVPSTFAFLFIIPLVVTVPSWASNRRGVVWVLAIFGALAAVYLPFALFLALAFVPLFFFSLHGNARMIFSIAALMLFAALVFTGAELSPYREYWRLSSLSAAEGWFAAFTTSFFVPIDATVHFAQSPGAVSVTGFGLLVFALVGVWKTWRSDWVRGLRWVLLAAAMNVTLVIFGGVSFLLFHQRAFHLFAAMAALWAVLGLAVLAREWYGWVTEKWGMRWRRTLVLVFAILTLSFVFFGYFRLPAGTSLYFLVNENDLVALRWLRGEPTLRGLKVVADPDVGTIVTPLTRLVSKVTLRTGQNTSSVINPASGRISFIESTCEEKREYLTRMDADIAYTRTSQSCPFLEEIFNTEGVFIYRINK